MNNPNLTTLKETMAAATPLVIKKNSQDAIIAFLRSCYDSYNNIWNIRSNMEIIDRAYMREKDYTKENQRAKLANRYGNPDKFQNVAVPVVMPQVESFVTYQSSVFLTGQPMFGWVAAPGQEDAALMYQAIIEENQTRGGWVQQFMMFFRDCAKYNQGILEVTWDRKVTAAIETAPLGSTTTTSNGVPKEVIWEGNCIRRWDMYNSFWDTRVLPMDMPTKGEFAGTTEIMGRVQLKKFFAELPDKMVQNIQAAFESGLGSAGVTSANGGIESFYVPQINSDALINNYDPRRSGPNWLQWAGVMERPDGEMAYKNNYEVTTLYARIIPQDFRLIVPGANTPQVWKFIIINHAIVVYAERQTNAHNLLPTLFGCPNNDGLGYQTKSFATNAIPFQDIASALVNSAMAAKRRAISDRGIYNPTLISAEHVNSDSPVAKIPMRPGAYGKSPQEAYMAIPFNDNVSGTSFQEMSQILNFANTVNGQNPAKQGQFTKGNRTQAEYDSIMANANGRDQVTSMLFEAQVFTPLKEILKINTMQYQAGITLYSPSAQQKVAVDPVALRKSFVAFKISDGLTPTDKLIDADSFTMAIQTMGSSEQIGAGYNLSPAFSYLMKTRNVDLTPFEKSPQQIAYEQAQGQWQQVVLQMAKQGLDAKQYPPQPTPEQYGYNPAAQSGNQIPPQTNPAPNTGGSPAQLGANSVPTTATQ